jgi:uncharacterized membrane protein
MSYGPPPPTPPQWGDQPYGGASVPHPRATLVLVFGILGLVCCTPFGIAAWVMGNNALREIDANPAAYNNRGTVTAGKICGIVSVCLGILGVLLSVALIALAMGTSTSP